MCRVVATPEESADEQYKDVQGKSSISETKGNEHL